MLAVVAEVRTCELGTWDPHIVCEAFPRHEPPDVTIVILSLAQVEEDALAIRNRRPGNTWSFELLPDAEGLRFDLIDAAQITRTDPKISGMPGQRLRSHRRRSVPLLLSDRRDHYFFG